MMKVSLVVVSITSVVLFPAARGQHLFEALLQRRAKPIRWKWNNDLISLTKPPEVQRQRRFLREPSMEKWWRTMTPPKLIKSDIHTTRENLDETIFRKPFLTTISRTKHLIEKDSKEHQNAIIANETQSFEEEINVQELPLNVFQTFSLPVNPFDKDNRVIIVTDYLSPTEKNDFNEQSYPDTFGDLRNIPQQKESESETHTTENEKQIIPTPSQPDADGEFLREAIIHEFHKPSKIEVHSASERLKEFQENSENVMKTMSSVEYIVPSVEHVVPEVEYIDNISVSEEKQVPDILPSVEYVAPAVEFVEPEVDYITPEFNSSDSIDFIEKEGEWGEDENLREESISDNDNDFIEQKFENKGSKTDSDGKIFQIVALRRQQIRVRRNHKKHKEQIGVPELDYPTLEALPVVQFYCRDYMPGYYVDITTRCQVFHLCHENGQRSSFLCPVGTIFNQKYLICDWWYNVDCEDSSKYLNSEILHAHSTTNEKQKIITNINPVKKEITSRRDEKSKNKSGSEYKESYDPNRNKNANMNENYTQKKLSNLSQKAVNYPMGYAILLREFMKNSAANNKINRDQNIFNNNKESIRSTEFNFEMMPTYDISEKSRKYITPEKTYSKIVQYPTKNDPQTYRDFPKLYINVSLSHSQRKNQEQKKHPKIEEYLPYFDTSHLSFLNANADKQKNILGTSVQKKPENKNKESLEEKPKLNKNTDIVIKDFGQFQENTRANSKHLFKSTKDFNRYHFIIDPKEAIKPIPGKQFSILDEQIKNNSAIKFRQAESTLKHIKPHSNKLSSIINIHNNSEDFIKPKEYSHIEYSSPVSFLNDHLIQNSAPRVSKTLNPTSNLNIQYGDRLSKHIRSISSFDEKLNPSILKSRVKNNLSLYNLQKQMFLNEEKKDNNTYASDLQQSETKFDVPNFNNYSQIVLNKNKELILDSENKSKLSNIKKDESIRSSVMDNQKITISVHIESKAVIKNNGSSPSNKKRTILMPENIFYTIQPNEQKSVVTIKPHYSYYNTTSENVKTLKNLSYRENLNKIAPNENIKNITKINNNHGGYILVKQVMYKYNNTATNNQNNNENYTSKAQKRVNETMWNMPFFFSF